MITATLVLAGVALAQPTVVHVLGTVHFPTEAVGPDDMVAALEAAAPDVVLMEIDHSVFDDDYQLTAAFDENEWNAVRAYVTTHPDVALRPYDRDERNATRARLGLRQMGRSLGFIEKQARRGRLDADAVEAVTRFGTLSAELRALGVGSLETINTPEADAVARERQHLQYVVFTDIVQRHERFAKKRVRDSNGDKRSVRELWTAYATFEREREAAMVDHIVEWTGAFPGQRLFVFAGFYHRPGLLDGLASAQEAHGFRLEPAGTSE